MADHDDFKFYAGYFVSDLYFLRPPFNYVKAFVRFWNENHADSWAPSMEVMPRDPQMVEVGWFLFQKACINRDPQHCWASMFSQEARPPYLDLGQTPISLSDKELASIQAKAQVHLIKLNRGRLLDQVKEGKISEKEAADEAKKHGWPPIPAKLAIEECRLPDQKWLKIGEVIVALVVGRPASLAILDPRTTPDAIKLAEQTLLKAAYQEHVHLHGKRGDSAGSSRIESWHFQKRPSVDLRFNRLNFSPWLRSEERNPTAPHIWSDVLVEVRTLKEWLDRQRATKITLLSGEIGPLQPEAVTPKREEQQTEHTPPVLEIEVKKNKRRRSHNESKGDELQEQLRKLKLVAEKETKFPVPTGTMTLVAQTVYKLGAKIGVKLKPGTIRQIFGDRYPPANRLVEERDIEAWWRGSIGAGNAASTTKPRKAGAASEAGNGG